MEKIFTPTVLCTPHIWRHVQRVQAVCQQTSGPHSQKKERETLQRGKACKDLNKIHNVKNNAHCSMSSQRQKNNEYATPLSEVYYNLTPAPMME